MRRIGQTGIGQRQALGQLGEARRIDQHGVGHAAVAVDAVQRLRPGLAQGRAAGDAGTTAEAVDERLHGDRPAVDGAGELVTEGHAGAESHDVEVAAADARAGDLDEHAVALGVGHLDHRDASVSGPHPDHDARTGPSTPAARSSSTVAGSKPSSARTSAVCSPYRGGTPPPEAVAPPKRAAGTG